MSSEEIQTAPETTVELSGGAPTLDQVEALVELAHAAEEADANPPFSEQTLVELHKAADAGGSDAPLHVAYAWASSDEGSTDHQHLLAGAGVVVLGDDGSPDVLELVVRPNCRQHGIGGQLTAALADDALAPRPGRVQRAWAHGEHDAAARLAARHGWAPVRELWRMRLASLDEVPSPRLPETVTVRSFVPGQDEESWLRANAAAFADHPEQGRLTRADLDARMAEGWFDPAGFLLAEEDGELLGFHWTKVHPGEAGGAEPLGEVYVVGVVPDAQGRGLGYSLTLAGIDHLRSQGLGAIMLYVDSDNTAAVELYRKLGFTRWDVDTMYAPVTEPGAEPA
ncbi:mycothiol synthase [Nesterenkonia suensis]